MVGLTSLIKQNHRLLKPHSRELSEDLVESEDRRARSKGRRKEKKVREGEGERSRYGRKHPLPCRQRLREALKPWKSHEWG